MGNHHWTLGQVNSLVNYGQPHGKSTRFHAWTLGQIHPLANHLGIPIGKSASTHHWSSGRVHPWTNLGKSIGIYSHHKRPSLPFFGNRLSDGGTLSPDDVKLRTPTPEFDP